MMRLFGFVLLSLVSLQGQGGVEVLTPRFRVVTELSEETALQAAEHLEKAHASLKAIGVDPRPVGHEPIPVLLLSTVAELEALFASCRRRLRARTVSTGRGPSLHRPRVGSAGIGTQWSCS